MKSKTKQQKPQTDLVEGLQFTPQGFQIDPTLLKRWVEDYPAVDVPLEVLHAHEWVIANPRRSKSNWRRFLVNWLKRSQDRARWRSQSRIGPTLEERKARTLEELARMRAEGRL